MLNFPNFAIAFLVITKINCDIEVIDEKQCNLYINEPGCASDSAYFNCLTAPCAVIWNCELIASDNKFREDVIYYHNFYRNRYAANEDKILNAVSYDVDLEKITECYLSECHAGPHSVDGCAKTKNFPETQQIKYAVTVRPMDDDFFDQFLTLQLENLTANAIKKLYASKGSVKYNKYNEQAEMVILSSGVVYNRSLGVLSYTANSLMSHVGCARSYYDDTYLFMACTYAPITLMNLSQELRHCDTYNKKFPNLCGEIDPIPLVGQNSCFRFNLCYEMRLVLLFFVLFNIVLRCSD